jgi:C4-dicarboxylate transporter DctM subunit
MSNFDIGIIGIIVLFILLFSRMPIGITMALVGFVGFAYVAGLNSALGVLKTVPYGTFASYTMSVVPLFILMGSFAFFSGLSRDLYDAVHAWIGHWRGGLAMATIGACAAFAAICGSSLATAATFGKVSLPEMRRYKYHMGLATAVVAAGGTIGILIPPSIIFVIYGILTGQSIGKLFLSGFLPGILQAIFYMATIAFLCWRNPLLGPSGPVTTTREKLTALKSAWIAVFLFLLVIGGLYLGVFSPTEAAGIGAFATLVFGISPRRLNWNGIIESLVDTGKNAGMIFLLLMGAMIFGYFLTVTGINTELAKMLSTLPVSRYVVLTIIIVIYLVLGCCMDSLAMILLTVPVFYPVIQALGFDGIWFGVIIVRMVEIGMITPPVGLNVFVIAGLAPDTPMYTIFKGIVPFIIADVIHVVLLVAFPEISLFLPSLMK